MAPVEDSDPLRLLRRHLPLRGRKRTGSSSSARLLLMAIGLTWAVVVLGACTATDAAPPAEDPITVEEVSGTDIRRLTLAASAADRLDIQTSTVELAGDGMVVSSAAVIIDPAGIYWVYTSPEPLVYVREEIRPVREAGGEAFFASGPAIGTIVVTVGVPELYGAEFGIGK